MSFSSTLLHARKSRANSEISELLTARRMDITVWMSSPNDVVPAVAEAGATRVARGGQLLQTVPERPSVAAWALVYPRVGDGARRQPGCCWPYAAGDNSRRRVSLLTHEYAGTLWSNVGPNISRSAGPHDSWRPRGHNWQQWHCPGPPFLCGASTRIPERPHTMFRLLNIFLASSVLGRTARTSHNGEPSLRQSLCTECTGSGLDFVYREVGRNAADNGLWLRSSSRAYVEVDFEVHEIFIETAESLNVWAVNFNAVVGGADGFRLSADGCSLRIFGGS
ncbi:hypothetical protein EVAR_77152_1 [Eumeta japonica]|uniref:Uncharacterized protein n=1 Tax=Eumeta variegata TaxID=151549 RepID=A0A4C1T2L8_EUMVA|nr:hypothetical protein EVAR_77152_1 [Eumeta japonica]